MKDPLLVRILRLKAWRDLFDINMQAYLIAFLYALIMVSPFSDQNPQKVFLLIGSLATYVCFGILLNDYYDMPIDLQAGKKTGVFEIPRSLSVALILATLIVSISLALLAKLGYLCYITFFSALFLAISYSAYPLRFKERGLTGVLVDVMMEKTLPIILIFVAFDYYSYDALLCVLLFTIMQFKVILDHQIFDHDDDLRLGVKTLVTTVGVEKPAYFVDKIIRPGYLITFIIFCIMVSLRLPNMTFVMISIFLGYFVTVLLLRRNIITRVNIRADVGDWIERVPLYDGYATASLGIILLSLAYTATFMNRAYLTLLFIALVSQLYIIRGHYLRIMRGILSLLLGKAR